MADEPRLVFYDEKGEVTTDLWNKIVRMRRADWIALQNKDTNTHTVGSVPSVGGGAK